MKYAVITAVVLALFSTGCTEKKTAAIVNGDEITVKALENRLSDRIKEHQQRGANVSKEAIKESVLEQMIAERLLLQGAKENNIAVADDTVHKEVSAARGRLGEAAYTKYLNDNALTAEEFTEKIRQKLTVEKFIASLVPPEAVPDGELQAIYRNSPTPFLRPESVEVRFIQTNTEVDARAVLAEMKQRGLDFDKMAVELAANKRALVSAYGWTQPDFFNPSIASALRKMKAGEHGGPFKGKDSYYLFRVKDKQAQGVKSFDEAKEEIRGQLLEQKRNAALSQWLAARKQHASIVIR